MLGLIHFVDAIYPNKKPWLTNIYFGQRNSSGLHAHIVASGSAIWYFRDEQGKEIVRDGCIVYEKL